MVNAFGGDTALTNNRTSRNSTLGPGIGGTGGSITISGGTVRADRGEHNGGWSWGGTVSYSLPIDPTPTITGGTVFQNGTPIPDPSTSTIEFRITGSWYTIVNYMSIDGSGVALNNLEIHDGTKLTVPTGMVQDGSYVSLTSTANPPNFIVGNAVYMSSTDTYRVTLSIDNTIKRANVKVYVNHNPLAESSGNFGSLSPFADFTLPFPGMDSGTQTFVLEVDPAFKFTGMETKNAQGNWVDMDTSRYTVTPDGSHRYFIEVTFSHTGSDVTEISFKVPRKTFTVTVEESLSGDETWKPSAPLITNGNPSTLSWDANNRVATETLYYGNNRTYTIDTANPSGNTYRLHAVIVNGVAVTPTDLGNGKYEVSISDVSSNESISVVYARTHKITADQLLVRANDSNARVTLLDADGNPASVTWSPDSSAPDLCYMYVPHGYNLKFRVDYTWGGNALVSAVFVNNEEIPLNSSKIYEVKNITADTFIKASLDTNIIDVTLVTYNSSKVIKVAAGVNVNMPKLTDFQGLGLSAKPG